MGNTKLGVYLFFKGDCREAMEFYKSVFGGEIETSAYDDIPSSTAAGLEGKLMHASLTGGEVDLMASDTLEASPKSAKVTLSLIGDDEAKLTGFFDELSEGIEVAHPLKKEMWGDIFGQLTDKYGVDWMVNITTPKT